MDVQNAVAVDFFKRLDAVPDEQLRAILKPYAERAAQARVGVFSKWSEEEFIKKATERKNGLRKMFEEHYAEIERQRRVALGLGQKGGASKTFTSLDQKWLAPIQEKHWTGNTAFVGGRDFQAHRFHVYGMDGQSITYMDAKLTAEGQAKLRGFLSNSGSIDLSSMAGSATPSTMAATDPNWPDILKGVKSVNYHMTPGSKGYDGIVPASTQTLLKDLAKKFFQPESSVPEHLRAMYKHYQKELAKVVTKDGVLVPFVPGTQVKQYVPAPASAPAPKPPTIPASDKPSVKRLGQFNEANKELVGGKIVQRTGFGNSFNGEVYEYDLGGGVKVQHITDSHLNLSSKQGRFRVVIEKDAAKLTASDIEDALGRLNKLGLTNSLATKDELELMTLTKVAERARLDHLPEFKVNPAVGTEENITKLKKAWEDRGYKLTAANGYEPHPVADSRHGTGWFRFQDFRVKVDDLVKDDVGLYLSLYRGIEADGKAIISNGSVAMVSTESRLRAGIASTGMSSSTDMSTGGADYVFTRLRTAGNAGGQIRLHPRLMRDAEAYSYADDMFGSRKATDLATTKTEVADWKALSKGWHSSNETMIPAHARFDDFIDQINAGGPRARSEIIGAFHKAGIKELNGRKVEDIVVESWQPLKK